MTVAKYGNLEIMKILVERGADVNAKAPGVSGGKKDYFLIAFGFCVQGLILIISIL